MSFLKTGTPKCSFKNLKKKSGNVFYYCAPRFHKPKIKIKNFAEMGHPSIPPAGCDQDCDTRADEVDLFVFCMYLRKSKI